jgi:hypothetical protein
MSSKRYTAEFCAEAVRHVTEQGIRFEKLQSRP